MPYIDRDLAGNIISIYEVPQHVGQEFVLNAALFVSLPYQAQTALNRSDVTMLRCIEAGIAVPSAWNTYRKALRAISTGLDKTSTTLPVQPPFVAGT